MKSLFSLEWLEIEKYSYSRLASYVAYITLQC